MATPVIDLSWRALPRVAQLYVVLTVIAGLVVSVETFPQTYPQPLLFAIVLLAGCVTAAWKVNLPIPLTSGSTLSVSCAAKLMALLLLGPAYAVIVAAAGALTQCTYKVKHAYPVYRTIFSVAAEIVAMSVTGLVYVWLGGVSPPLDIVSLAKPLVGTIATYFLLDTVLVAVAIALSTHRTVADVWRNDFLWSGVTFMVAGTAGAAAALVIANGYHWIAILTLAPLYLTYRTYELFIGRLEDKERHMGEMGRMHERTVDALSQAHEAEWALAAEKERLSMALTEMTRLEGMRKDLLEREHAARSSAEEANRVKDQFLAIVSHELRTPLNAILGWSDMLKSGKLSEAKRERAFAAIHDGATRQAQLIDDLLDIARIMSGKLRLERTFVDLEGVLRVAVNIVQPAADAKQIVVGLKLDANVGVIYVDRTRLQQIAWNLLSNAIKFTPEGGAVQLHVSRAGDSVELMVIDTGEGIPQNFLGSVFEPFRQADASTTRRHGGLGLGLSIAKHLVEAHGGMITVQSGGEGLGATFCVRLPIAPSSAAQAEVAMAERASSTSTRVACPPTVLEGLRVLVVDDEEQGRQVVTQQLENHRAVVLTAASAAQALETLQREHVDVLLADIAMPGEDGYALIRQLRAMHPAPIASIPAAALTAFARAEDRLAALQAGYQVHLAKPVDVYSLVTTVARLGGKLPDRRTPRVPAPAEQSIVVH